MLQHKICYAFIYMIGEKKKYKRRIAPRVMRGQKFLLAQLQKDWDELQRGARKEELVRRAKEGGEQIGKILLTLLAVGGAITIAAVAPNIFAAVGKSRREQWFFNEDDFRRCRNYFVKQGYASFANRGGATVVRLLQSGRTHILRSAFEHLSFPIAKQWDGFWRVIIFDIPDRHKWAREGFRKALRQIGMHCMQESVFVSPHPCEDALQFLISVFSLSPHVRFIKTEHLDDDSDLKEVFGIK